MIDCPHCKARCMANALKCHNCGQDLYPVPVPSGPEGNCPKCGRITIRLHKQYEGHNLGCGMSAAGLVLVLMGVPLLLLGIGMFFIIGGIMLTVIALFLPNRRLINTAKECRDCGHKWLT